MSRILLLEDDEALAAGLLYTLKDEGFEVVHSSCVKEALEVLHKESFDMALLDITLPDGSGYDVCREIRSSNAMPVVFLTACDDEVNVVLGLDMGADDYISKPFRVRELISRIKAVLRRYERKTEMTAVLRSGDVEINLELAEITKGSEKLKLSSQEYKLLIILMSNPKVLMSRDEILQKLIEGAGAYYDTNTLSVYIKRIREKIEENPSEPEYILNKRGLGYIWDKEVERK